MNRPVFVTGVGLICPAGTGTDDAWRSITYNRVFVTIIDFNNPDTPKITKEPINTFCSFVLPHALLGAPVRPRPSSAPGDPLVSMALEAAGEAVHAAGLRPGDWAPFGPDRVRVSIGTSKGSFIALARLADRQGGHDAPDAWRRTWQQAPPDAAARAVARQYGLTGGAHATVAACATGTLAIIRGAQWIREDQADLVLAGASDASLTPLWLAALDRMGVLAPPHPTFGPAYACRPFDRTRQGFAIGEGAAVLVLESDRSVLRRGVEPLARIAGLAAGNDPAGLTRLTPGAEPLARVIAEAIRDAATPAGSLAAVLAHGTGTPSNDRGETAAIRRAVGQAVRQVPIVSVKGAIGHLLGAAGAVEAALAVLAVRHRLLPGTVTLLEPDPELSDLNLPRRAIPIDAGPVLKTTLGFGGHLAVIVLDAP